MAPDLVVEICDDWFDEAGARGLVDSLWDFLKRTYNDGLMGPIELE